MIWLELLRKAWPLVLGGLLLAGAWMLVQSHRQEAERNGELAEQVEQLREDLVEEAAVADVIADQAAVSRQALKKRESQLHQLRRDHERLRTELRQVVADAPAGDCLRLPVHPAADQLLRRAGADRPSADPGEP